ncbi:Mitogen-activated protein kinase HOG1 [Penicillium subrubescens]|uniref:Mitogen-activated protein kinase HOG1 n=1 Tax=Penicillium subrubescens TaxID=1316194 RepID=A0A1Q5U7X7_9EURO|nr:Mitogen-activated protein kinase HOG1 [Penicillium subrubescens]
MTGYVTTRFYRAPETMLTWQKYNVEVDMWSAGCILAEMIEGSPLFPGRNHTDQFLTSEYITGLPERAKVPFANKIKQALPDGMSQAGLHLRKVAHLITALDLLEQLLVWNPEQRITAEAALSHPYLSVYHDPSDEPTANQTFDWSSIDADHGIDTWKTLVYVLLYETHVLSLIKVLDILRFWTISAVSAPLEPTLLNVDNKANKYTTFGLNILRDDDIFRALVAICPSTCKGDGDFDISAIPAHVTTCCRLSTT